MKLSAGLVVYKFSAEQALMIFLVHPGGPLWKNKDEGAWSIPKGEYITGEDPLTVAKKEFAEETGNIPPEGHYTGFEPFKTKGGKIITSFAIKGDFEKCFISSNYFEMEWPPKSGKKQSFPEVDDAGWFTIEIAAKKINHSQSKLLTQLEILVSEFKATF